MRPEPTAYVSQIKSRDRVRDNGEVFTASREVDGMLGLLPPETWTDPDKRFLEPACGHGNFITAIIKRKIEADNAPSRRVGPGYEFFLMRTVASVYGIDISHDNVLETRARVLGIVEKAYPHRRGGTTDAFFGSVRHILCTNIVHGDGLTGLAEASNGEPEPFLVVEYVPDLKNKKFERTIRRFVDVAGISDGEASLFDPHPAPVSIEATNYLALHLLAEGSEHVAV